MRRTVKRYSPQINQGKWQQLCQIARLFRDEKNYHLRYYNQDPCYSGDKDDTQLRDDLVAQKYKPDTKLQARQWKMTVKTAHDTVERN
jgi:hypothetical protein